MTDAYSENEAWAREWDYYEARQREEDLQKEREDYNIIPKDYDSNNDGRCA